MLPGYRERFCEVFGEDSWQIKDEWSHYQRIDVWCAICMVGLPPPQSLGLGACLARSLDCFAELLHRVGGMTLSFRQIEVFRADPDDLPEFF